jgi:hypothetical protein
MSASGGTIHLHYCMGELVQTSLFKSSTGRCVKCGMQKHKEGVDCCKDVQVVIKSADKHIASFPVSLVPPVLQTALVPEAICDNGLRYTVVPAKGLSHTHAPPLSPVPIYLQVGNFRI